MDDFASRLADTLQDLRDAGTYKVLRQITTPMDTVVHIDGVGEVLVFCSNN
ncbi:MAG: glycine C-acetyltransferase, partial [Gammaproteobacteria bacterium]|nr:glycine C-acetyltransferase [Gammaproteobacteria bacterium]